MAMRTLIGAIALLMAAPLAEAAPTSTDASARPPPNVTVVHITQRAERLMPRDHLRAGLAVEATGPVAQQVQAQMAQLVLRPQDANVRLTQSHQAGAPALMTPEVIATLADHAQGNLRSLMIMADELLAAAAERQAERIDEALLFEACALAPQPKAVAGKRR